MTDCGCTNFPASLGNITFGASVGIGTTSPLATLDVDSATAPQLVVRGGSTSSVRVFPAPGDAISSVEAFSAADSIPSPSNFNRLRLTIDGQTASLVADAGGTGAALPLALSAGGAERLRIMPGGNVGVGTTTPGALLSLGGAVQTNKLYLYEAGGTVYGLGIAPNTLQIYSSSVIETAVAFGTSDGTTFNEGMRLQGGNLGIGTTNPIYTLHVHGADAAGSGIYVDTAGFTNLPASLGLLQGVILNARGLNVASDNATLSAGPTSGVGIAVTRAGAALGVRNNSGYAAVFEAGYVGVGTTSPGYPLDVAGTVRCTGVLLGGNMNLAGAIYDSTGKDKRVDYQGCYYA